MVQLATDIDRRYTLAPWFEHVVGLRPHIAVAIDPERHHHVVGGGEHLRLRLLGGHGAPFAGRALDEHDRSARD